MMFRKKGADQVLVPRVTEEGTIVLWPVDDDDKLCLKQHYIDEYFDSHDFEVPPLQYSADGEVWVDL